MHVVVPIVNRNVGRFVRTRTARVCLAATRTVAPGTAAFWMTVCWSAIFSTAALVIVDAARLAAQTPGADPFAEMMAEDPEFAAARTRAQSNFADAKTQFVDAMLTLRTTHLRYRNREARTPQDRRDFYRQKRDAQLAMNDLLDAALDYLRVGGDPEAVQFASTAVQNRRNNDIYDVTSLEVAARLIDGGSRDLHLFESGARSAMVVGDFDLAKRLYDALIEDEKVEIKKSDQLMVQWMDQFKADFELETNRRQQDPSAELPRVRFRTTQGEFEIELFIDDAPSTVAHFLRLVQNGFYDGLDFTQVIDNLLALTGDRSGNGTGNSGQFLIDESQGPDAPRRALRGSVLMAKLPTKDGKFIPNSASSQIAILFLPRLNVHEDQTIIGRVVQGMDVVSRMRRIDPSKEKKKGEVEIEPDSILSAEIVVPPQEWPTPEYLGGSSQTSKQAVVSQTSPQ